MACHAIETYKDRLKNPQELEKLKIHCRRAMLESILMKKSEKLRHKALKPVKRPQELTFAEYALKATENLPEEFQSNLAYGVFSLYLSFLIRQSPMEKYYCKNHYSNLVKSLDCCNGFFSNLVNFASLL